MERAPRARSHALDVAQCGGGVFAGCVLLVAVGAAGIKEMADAFGWLWPASLVQTAAAIVACAAVAALLVARVYARRPDSLLRWEEVCGALALDAASLAACAWALDDSAASPLPREHTLWRALWRADVAGMHLDRMWTIDVSGKVIHRWEFAHVPEGMRHVPWPDGPTSWWADQSKSVLLRMSLPPMTAHARLALHARLSPPAQQTPMHTR